MQGQQRFLKHQELQRLQADLVLQSKELDAREAFLNERERIIESSPFDLKVLEETIAVKKGQLEQIKETFKKKEAWYKTRLDGLEHEVTDKEVELTDTTDELLDVTELISSYEIQTKAANSDLHSIEKQIATRQQYLKDQERLIEETIDEGNAALRGISYEIQAAQEQKDVAKAELADVETRKTDVAFELMELEERLKQDKFDYEQEIDAVKKELADERKNVGQIHAEYDLVSANISDKLRQLEIKEKEIMTKQSALIRERNELEDDKRRWHSTKSLYDIK